MFILCMYASNGLRLQPADSFVVYVPSPIPDADG